MKRHLLTLLLGLGLSTAVVSPVAAYPVDCAILLCLAGGWPASAECAQARAVFIRRITPWPIEPPLQIWNCPMRAGLRVQPKPLARLFGIALQGTPASRPRDLRADHLNDADPVDYRADIDISGPAFDFIRSIHVFEIEFQQYRTTKKKCSAVASIVQGSYGVQGQYRRRARSLAILPKVSALAPPPFCETYRYRSVLVEWHDYQGQYGFEEIQY